MKHFNHNELREGEVFVFNSRKERLPNYGGRLKTMRFGKSAYDVYGKILSPKEGMLPVFIHKSETELLDKLWKQKLGL